MKFNYEKFLRDLRTPELIPMVKKIIKNTKFNYKHKNHYELATIYILEINNYTNRFFKKDNFKKKELCKMMNVKYENINFHIDFYKKYHGHDYYIDYTEYLTKEAKDFIESRDNKATNTLLKSIDKLSFFNYEYNGETLRVKKFPEDIDLKKLKIARILYKNEFPIDEDKSNKLLKAASEEDDFPIRHKLLQGALYYNSTNINILLKMIIIFKYVEEPIFNLVKRFFERKFLEDNSEYFVVLNKVDMTAYFDVCKKQLNKLIDYSYYDLSSLLIDKISTLDKEGRTDLTCQKLLILFLSEKTKEFKEYLNSLEDGIYKALFSILLVIPRGKKERYKTYDKCLSFNKYIFSVIRAKSYRWDDVQFDEYESGSVEEAYQLYNDVFNFLPYTISNVLEETIEEYEKSKLSSKSLCVIKQDDLERLSIALDFYSLRSDNINNPLYAKYYKSQKVIKRLEKRMPLEDIVKFENKEMLLELTEEEKEVLTKVLFETYREYPYSDDIVVGLILKGLIFYVTERYFSLTPAGEYLTERYIIEKSSIEGETLYNNLLGILNMYGVIKYDNLKMLCEYNNIECPELSVLIDISKDEHGIYYSDGYISFRNLSKDIIKKVIKEQESRPFYLAELADLKGFKEFTYVRDSKAVENFVSFCEKECVSDIEELTSIIIDCSRKEIEINNLFGMDLISDFFRVRDIEHVNIIMKNMSTLINKIGKWILNGYSPDELASVNNRTKIGRNDICHCGSGLKYKKCCLLKEN